MIALGSPKWINCWIMGTLIPWAPYLTAHAETSVDFTTQVRPILVDHCFRCHSQLKQESKLRLDSVEWMMKGGERGAAIVPGDHERSRLMQAILGTRDLSMPPAGDRLRKEQIELVAKWIDEGARAAEPEDIARAHWAFQTPVKIDLPNANAWTRNPIDVFFSKAHRRMGLRASPAAHKGRLLRRVYLDLIGVPPLPKELDAFLQDNAPDAYERVVDRLLLDPRHGERWARHWMDIWRYSDWAGHRNEIRNSQPHIWRWRDWIIESLNRDKPYDRMIVEMLAGDEVAPDDPQTLRATGFLVRNWYSGSRNVWLQDTTDHTAKGFLGLTLACARCHDHMYDPISQEDYFRFRAFFEPHEIRTDPLDGQPDTKNDGLVRVYDAHPDAATVFFPNGDDRRPDTSRIFQPAPPRVIRREIDIQPVALPVSAYYPGSTPTFQHAALEATRSRLSAAEQALAAARAKLEEARQKVNDGSTMDTVSTTSNDKPPAVLPVRETSVSTIAWRLAEQETVWAEARHAAAKQEVAAMIARTKADAARYSIPVSQGTPLLIAAAVAAEADAAVLNAAAEALGAEVAQGKAEAAQPPNAAELETARKRVLALREAYDQAVSRRESPDDDYTPIGTKYPDTSTGRRLALARWITDRQNPLTARVAVNHIWTRHFGRPLVDRVDDLGIMSPPPRMQTLLDWLAVEFMERDWTMRAMHRLIVTSSLYRMDYGDSQDSAGNHSLDEANHYHWQWEPRRMEAELVRDALLHVSGQLDLTHGGPELDQHAGQTSNRRSLYFRHAAEKQMLFLKLFDAANMEECYRRVQTTSPQQALALFNSPMSIRCARLLARDLSSEQVGTSLQRKQPFVQAAYLRILCREPTEKELNDCCRFLERQSELLTHRAELSTFTGAPASTVAASIHPEERARENLVQVLLNLSEFVTIR